MTRGNPKPDWVWKLLLGNLMFADVLDNHWWAHPWTAPDLKSACVGLKDKHNGAQNEIRN